MKCEACGAEILGKAVEFGDAGKLSILLKSYRLNFDGTYSEASLCHACFRLVMSSAIEGSPLSEKPLSHPKKDIWDCVPEGYDWIAMDWDGKWFCFKSMPRITDGVNIWSTLPETKEIDYVRFECDYHPANWEWTRMHRPERSRT